MADALASLKASRTPPGNIASRWDHQSVYPEFNPDGHTDIFRQNTVTGER